MANDTAQHPPSDIYQIKALIYYCTECINASQHPGNPCVQEPELGHLTSGVATAESCAAGTVKAVMMKIHRCDLPMMWHQMVWPAGPCHLSFVQYAYRASTCQPF